MLVTKKKSTEELLKRMSANNKKVKIQKLESDEQGRLLLDPTNKHHRAWIENDADYEVIDESED